MTETIILYLITATDGAGDSLELFVNATSADQAIEIWLDYYAIDKNTVSSDFKVFSVSADRGNSGPLPWHSAVPQQPTSTPVRAQVLQSTEPVMLIDREFDTVLAALRVYQHYLDHELGDDPEFDSFIRAIATDHSRALNSDEIDELCERINCG